MSEFDFVAEGVLEDIKSGTSFEGVVSEFDFLATIVLEGLKQGIF